MEHDKLAKSHGISCSVTEIYQFCPKNVPNLYVHMGHIFQNSNGNRLPGRIPGKVWQTKRENRNKEVVFSISIHLYFHANHNAPLSRVYKCTSLHYCINSQWLLFFFSS